MTCKTLAQTPTNSKIDLSMLDMSALAKALTTQNLSLDASPCKTSKCTMFYRFGNDFLHIYATEDGRYRALINPNGEYGRETKFGMLQSHFKELPSVHAPTLRAVKQTLEKYILENNLDTSLHWISVIGENSWAPQTKLYWLHDDDLIDIAIGDGSSEGSMIFVTARPQYNDIFMCVPLFQIKVLCGNTGAFDEAKVIYKFFSSAEFSALKNQFKPANVLA